MNSERLCFIYALFDPREPDVVRYIGKTMHPESRWNAHVRNSKYLKCHRSSWIVSLLRAGVKPVMRIVAICPEDVWQDFERAIVSKYKSDRLTNGNEGGVGGGTPEAWVREKIGRSRKAIAPSISGRMSVAFKKKWQDPEYRERVSAAHRGKKQSPEVIEKRIRPMRGRVHSEQEKQNRRAAIIGRIGSKVQNLDTEEVFDSFASAVRSVGLTAKDYARLSRAFSDTTKLAVFRGYRWEKL